jgi:hypothetical protein
MTSSATLAGRLAGWASGLTPTREDLGLATRSLRDTLAVTIAARDDDICAVVAESSTTHISVVCVLQRVVAADRDRGGGVVAAVDQQVVAGPQHPGCLA